MKFIASIRRKLLARRIHREIKHRVFPQLAEDKNCGYPFQTEDELWQCALRGELDAELHQKLLQKAECMGNNYGQAFRYIMYRDLNARMKMYLEFVEERTPRQAPAPQAQSQFAT
jgi:hypothetical protein